MQKLSSELRRHYFDLAVKELFDSQLPNALDRLQTEIISRRGRADGKNAAEWAYSNNTPDSTIKAIQYGIIEGDPAAMENLPQPRLGGEMADDPTWTDVLADELGIPAGAAEAWDADHLYETYCTEFADAVETFVMNLTWLCPFCENNHLRYALGTTTSLHTQEPVVLMVEENGTPHSCVPRVD